MSATAYRSAWADPEHMRLAAERSEWDRTTGPVTRLRARDPADPWLDVIPQQADLPAGFTHGPLAALADEYASRRCSCRHLVYDTDLDGGFCRFCGCSDHSAICSRQAIPR